MSLAQGLQIREQRKQRQAIAKERNEELQRLGYKFGDDGEMFVREGSAAQAEQLQAKEAAQLAKALQAKLAAQSTDRAFEDFSLTGDASYLQGALDNDPQLKNAWAQRGVQMVQSLDFENDRDLLSRAGMTDTFYDTDEKKEVLKKNIYKVYNGKDWEIGMAGQAAAETGVFTRLGKRRAEPIVNNQQQLVSMLRGPKVSPYTAEGHKYEKYITEAAKKYDLPADLIAAQIHIESSGNSKAQSPKGALGLMQLMPETAQELGVSDPLDPAQNIEGGAKYMRQMLDKYNGDVKLALAAYNAGPGNVDKYNGVPPFGETQNYVQKILTGLDQGQQFYGSNADNVINTILEQRRSMANAEKGTTNANIDREVAQTDKALLQKDKELELKSMDQQIELIKNNTKLMTEGSTTTQKDLNAALNTTTELFETFGGEENFYSTDFSDPKAYREAYKYVNAIEQLEGTELSEADKKIITDTRQLIALGDPAAKLTASQTGIIDSNLRSLEKYFSENVKGTEAKSAYAAFRNSVRNALFGSALTEAEIKSFDDAYGKLGNKLGPVLQQFETSLLQVQAKLDSTANMMNPISAKVRLGADQEKLTSIRDALQARIDYISGLQGKKTNSKTLEVDKQGNTVTDKPSVPAQDRPSLDAIFKG